MNGAGIEQYSRRRRRELFSRRWIGWLGHCPRLSFSILSFGEATGGEATGFPLHRVD
jgi:hypothetical protein